MTKVRSELTQQGIWHRFNDMPLTDTKKFNKSIHRLFIDDADSSDVTEKWITYRNFFPKDRYFFDFNMDMTNWMQIDTEQDAPYYGNWINPSLLTYISYVEGDVSVVVSDSEESFIEYLNIVKQWNVDSGYGFKIDPGLKPCEYNKKFLENFKGDVH